MSIYAVICHGDIEMKYYCIGSPVELVKTSFSPRFWENWPVIGSPIGSPVKVTPTMMRSAFHASQDLTLCKTLDEAKRLRLIRIENSSAKIKTDDESINDESVSSSGYPRNDYVIYEVDVEDKLANTLQFTKVKDLDVSDDKLLRTLSATDFHHTLKKKIEVYQTSKDTDIDDETYSPLFEVELCQVPKSDVSPTLARCFYIDWAEGTAVSIGADNKVRPEIAGIGQDKTRSSSSPKH